MIHDYNCYIEVYSRTTSVGVIILHSLGRAVELGSFCVVTQFQGILRHYADSSGRVSLNAGQFKNTVTYLLQQLECLTFSRDGREFVSSHTDGSYIVWTTDEPNFPKEPATTPYGNYWRMLPVVFGVVVVIETLARFYKLLAFCRFIFSARCYAECSY